MTDYIIRNHSDDDYEYEYDEDGNIVYYAVRPNKTQIKKEIAVLLALGEEISNLPSAQITALSLPEKLDASIREIAKMPHKGARKRQLKFIAQQFYKMDDIQPILDKVAKFKNQSSHAVREHHAAERWRERLLTEGQVALTALLDDYPMADRQQLRLLIRQALKERELTTPPKASRQLYRYLKQLFDEDNEQQAASMDDFEEGEDEILDD
jgi:ribosome-associated protein